MRASIVHFMKFQFPAIFWALVIFIASSIPSTKLPELPLLQYDKLIHAIIFFVFGLLVYLALEPERKQGGTFDWKRGSIVLLCVMIYGASDEFHQGFVSGRQKDILDLAADTIGGCCAILFVIVLSYVRMRKNTSNR